MLEPMGRHENRGGEKASQGAVGDYNGAVGDRKGAVGDCKGGCRGLRAPADESFCDPYSRAADRGRESR